MRLEDFLLDHFRDLSKMYLRDLVKYADCEVNGRHENIGFRLRPNDFIEIKVDSTRGTSMRPENIELDIVFEDAEIIVINKPAGMLVHPSHRENNGTLLNALAYYLNRHTGPVPSDSSAGETPVPSLRSERFIRPGLPHRLDKDTSGLLAVAKTARAHRILSGHFMKKRIEKRYLALVEGFVSNDFGTIEAPIGRFDELKFYGVKKDGKHSESKFRVLDRFTDTTLLELEPVTGRTNQLRIHCQHIGHPIVGDTDRGGREFERLCLHAHRLAFPHPQTRERMEFEIAIDLSF